MKRRPPDWLKARALWYAASALALALVFASYLQPGLMFDLANRVWSCF